MKISGCCGRTGSVAALKYSVMGLYLLVLLILVGVFILAGEAGPAPPGIPQNSCPGRVFWAVAGREFGMQQNFKEL